MILAEFTHDHRDGGRKLSVGLAGATVVVQVDRDYPLREAQLSPAMARAVAEALRAAADRAERAGT